MEFDNHFWLAIMHTIVVAPVFLFIGLKRAQTPHWMYLALIIIGIIIFIYHGIKIIIRIGIQSGYIWINSLHLLLVAPLLIYIGYHKKYTPRFAYELLLMLGFASGGYHLLTIVKRLDSYSENTLF